MIPVRTIYRFSQRSIDNLAGVHPDLVAAAVLALRRSDVDFGITEGVRSAVRQRALYEAGQSQTPNNSRHMTGHAIDVVAWVGGSISWKWEYYERINWAFRLAQKELSVSIVWGGSWTMKDGVHFELSREDYPA